MSLLNDIPLLCRERFHLRLLPELVEVLLVLQYGHVLDIASGHALLFGLLVAFDGFPWAADAGLAVRAGGLVGCVRRSPRLSLHW